MANTGYQNRRYKVIGGKLEKSWVAPPSAGWFVKKADAWADEAEKSAEAKAWNEALAAKTKVRDDELAAEEAAEKKAKADERAEAEAVRLAEEAVTATKLAQEAQARLANGGEPVTTAPPAVETPDPTTPAPETVQVPPESAPEPDLASTPPAPMLRMKIVMTRTGLSRVAIQRAVAAGTFPAAHDLGKGELCWPAEKIETWLQNWPDAPNAPDPEAA